MNWQAIVLKSMLVFKNKKLLIVFSLSFLFCVKLFIVQASVLTSKCVMKLYFKLKKSS